MANLKDLLVNGVSRFIGKVYAPTPEAGDNSTQVATTAFITSSISTKQDVAPTVTTLTDAATVALVDNSINRITISTATTFTLPTITDNTKLHQILVQVNLTAVVSINVGTTYFFNSTAPDLSTTGLYNLIFEYDGTHWVCGSLDIGVAA